MQTGLCTFPYAQCSGAHIPGRKRGTKHMCVSHTDAAALLMGTPFILQGLFARTESNTLCCKLQLFTGTDCFCSHPQGMALPNILGLHMEPALPHKTSSQTPKPEQENVKETLSSVWIPADPHPCTDRLLQTCSHTGEQKQGIPILSNSTNFG